MHDHIDQCFNNNKVLEFQLGTGNKYYVERGPSMGLQSQIGTLPLEDLVEKK